MFATKRLRYATLLLSTGLLFAGCAGESDETLDPETPDDEVIAPELDDDTDEESDTDSENGDAQEEDEDAFAVSQDLELWLPKTENTLFDYEGDGIEYASFTRYPQFAHEDTYQFVEATSGTDVVFVYEYSDDEVRERFVRPETYFRDDVMDTGLSSSQEDHEIILQLPIEMGHSWESPTGSTSEITDVEFEIDTEFGTFEAIEVTRTIDDNDIIYYYAEGIGLVERVSNPGDDEMEITSTLVSRSEDVPEELSLTLFTLDDQGESLNASNVTIELFTNEPIRLALADALRGEAPDTETAAMITEGVDINYMFLGENDIAYADFSVELIEEMNAGAGIESLIIQGLLNTIGGYYNVEDVLLTVDGEPYSSGHLELSEGETWTVDHSNVTWE
ncbi:MAG: GerMN domain-containing protein [Alkalibacterium sp.]|nr:GerMN domain-containing protein [Alkalibacterium sp.]